MDKIYIFALIYLGLCIVISNLFLGPDKNIKIIFYLIMFLLYISMNNVYYSFNYYVKLRNHKGLKGDRGDPGDQGLKGSNGTCIMSKGCGILNCKNLILEELMIKFPEIKPIINKVDDNISLSPIEEKKYNLVNKYTDILLPQCNEYEDGVDKFREIIAKTISK